jgi:hypothetical protein
LRALIFIGKPNFCHRLDFDRIASIAAGYLAASRAKL